MNFVVNYVDEDHFIGSWRKEVLNEQNTAAAARRILRSNWKNLKICSCQKNCLNRQLWEELFEAIGKSAAVRRFVRSNLKNLIITKVHLRRRRRIRKEVRFHDVKKKKAEYLELPSVYFFRSAVRVKNFLKRRRILFCTVWYSKIPMYFNIAAAENSTHNYNNHVIQQKRFI